MLLIKLFRIGPVTGPKSAILVLRLRTNTADLGPVTGPIQNNLICNVIILHVPVYERYNGFLFYL